MQRLTPDLCILGAGAGGLSLAAAAVQMGASVVVIESGRMGGDCLNSGCVPSKALIAAARQAHAMTAGAALGIAPAVPSVGREAVTAHIAGVIAAIAPTDSQERFEALGCIVLRAPGAFVSPREVEADGMCIAARRFVIATGSEPLIPPIAGLETVPFLTTESLWDLRARPRHLLVLGGGPVGIELAQAHCRLGAAVTVFDAGPMLGREDPEAAAVARHALGAEGVALHEGVAVERVSGHAGAITVTAGGHSVTGTHLLVAAGRRARIAGLNLAAAGIAADTAIRTDARLRTSNRRVFAIGDVTGRPQFTHAANHHAGIVLRQALFGMPARVDDNAIPRVTFTDPELAQAGLTEAQARARYGARLTVTRADFAENDRARTEAATAGFVKLMIHRGRPVGATIVGPGAGEQIALWSLAIGARMRLSAVAGTVLPYPTLSEASKRAAGAYFSPRLFGNRWVARTVRVLQRLLP